jgi:hypothetical protein
MAIPAKDTQLISSVELQAFLQCTIADADLVNLLINSASDLINKITDRHILSKAYTDEKYTGARGRYIYLKNYPITAVASVKVWDIFNNIVLTTLIENIEYQILTDQGGIEVFAGTYKFNNIYRISYTAGYAIADVPWDLKRATAEIAGMLYRGKGKTGVQSERIGEYSVAYKDNQAPLIGAIPVPPEIWAVLQGYRNYNIQAG